MRVLAVTTEPITAEALREALPEDIDPSEVEVMVVAPGSRPRPTPERVTLRMPRRTLCSASQPTGSCSSSTPEGERRYREDAEEGEFRERFGLPVDRVEISSGSE
jgi:hypothetical protein